MKISWKKPSPFATPVRNRIEYADYDYIDKLSPEDLIWLKGFNREYYNADFKHSFKKLIKKKKNSYNDNNARNRCLYGNYKVWGRLRFNKESRKLGWLDYLWIK